MRLIGFLVDLWDDLPWYGRVVIFGLIPLMLVAEAFGWAVLLTGGGSS